MLIIMMIGVELNIELVLPPGPMCMIAIKPIVMRQKLPFNITCTNR